MFNGLRIVQVVSLLSSIMTAFSLLYVYLRALDKRRRAYMIAPFFYFINIVIFYIFVFLNSAGVLSLTILPTWSAALNLHAIITIVGLLYIVLKQSKWLTG
jgi:hypothetical protein